MVATISSPLGNAYTQQSVLGNGAFGTVLLCHDIADVKCVVKRVRLARQSAQERFASVQELAVMQQLRHRNLVRSVEGWVDKSHTACLVMDYCGGGDLASYLQGRKGDRLHEDDVCMMLVQVSILL
jgi:serine/threonine protein kinase